MKKRVMAAILCMALAVGMTACGGGSNNSSASAESQAEAADITGDWALSTIQDADGNEYSLAEYCESQGVDSGNMECTYSFDGEETVTGAIGGIAVEGTYSFDGETVAVTFNGTTSNLTYDADADTISASDANSGITSIMVRQ